MVSCDFCFIIIFDLFAFCSALGASFGRQKAEVFYLIVFIRISVLFQWKGAFMSSVLVKVTGEVDDN